jgi:hypothetical protein
MTGHVQNGVVILDDPNQLPEGAVVRIELVASPADVPPLPRRRGGVWKGQVRMAADFDELPEELRDAFEMNS